MAHINPLMTRPLAVTNNHRFYLICLALMVSAGLWGLYWIPQRLLQSHGLTGGWGIVAQYAISTILLLPLAVIRYRKGKQTGLDLVLAGTLMGGGIVCYANSFLLTDVIRTLVLFYLTPFWATLIELLLLKQRPGWWRMVSLPLSLLGVSIVIGNDGGFPLPSNTGDWLAVAGGLIYALGAARVQVSRIDGVFPILFAFFVYGLLFALLQGLLLRDALGSLPNIQSLWLMLPWLLLLSICFFIPTNAIISWAPTQLGTGLFSILILSELIFGSVSAALWANEGFGGREVIGSLLIIAAGALEVALAPKHEL